MPSKNCRYFCLDSSGKLYGAEWFYPASDDEAVAQIKAKHPGNTCEIWQGQRLVAKVEPYPMNQTLASSRRVLAEARRVLDETADITSVPAGLRREDDVR